MGKWVECITEMAGSLEDRQRHLLLLAGAERGMSGFRQGPLAQLFELEQAHKLRQILEISIEDQTEE